MDQTVAWAEKYRPQTTSGLLGNEEAVATFKDWLKKWTQNRKPAKACLLVGPPGVGKTTLARAGANDFGFRTVEMNASDVRTQKTIEALLAPATSSAPLDSFYRNVRGNLILMDEVDGVFGREDRGGLGAILSMVRESPVPIVLTANDVEDERFDDLRKACIVVELVEIRPRLLIPLLGYILNREGASVPRRAVKDIARKSHGDIRSAINDIQALAFSRAPARAPLRTRELDEKQTLKGMFESGNHSRARRVLNETEIPLYRDELILLIHDLLPYVYTSPGKLAQAYEALSRADMGYGRIGASRSRGMSPPPFNLPRRDAAPQWSLLPLALNELALVGLQPPDTDIEQVLATAPRISKRVLDRYQYRLWALDHICARTARACHVSKRTALRDILPSLVALFRLNVEKARTLATSLNLDERDINFLLSESKMKATPTGPQEVLDPDGFKLPYMGRDKFIQLMRIGLRYDRNTGMFVARRKDNLESVEESLSQIISKAVRFRRAEPVLAEPTDEIAKECYIDGQRVICNQCEFVDDCPTHILTARKFCLCDTSLADPKCYEKYVTKNISLEKPPRAPKAAGTRKKRKGRES